MHFLGFARILKFFELFENFVTYLHKYTLEAFHATYELSPNENLISLNYLKIYFPFLKPRSEDNHTARN